MRLIKKQKQSDSLLIFKKNKDIIVKSKYSESEKSLYKDSEKALQQIHDKKYYSD